MQKLNNRAFRRKKGKIRIFSVKLYRFYAAALIFTFLSVTAVTAAVSISRSAPDAAYTVVIDAGHGGVDGGVTGSVTGVKESDLNLDMSKALGGYFEKAGVNVVYTRKTKAGLYSSVNGDFKKEDFLRRREIISNAAPDLVISVHMNFFKRAAYRRGAQVFFNPRDNSSRELAYAMQDKLNEEINAKYSKRNYGCLAGDYYILNTTPFPAVLVECGFLSNAEDEKLLTTKEYREELAYYIFTASMAYLFTH